jgi:hypothetical protein
VWHDAIRWARKPGSDEASEYVSEAEAGRYQGGGMKRLMESKRGQVRQMIDRCQLLIHVGSHILKNETR